MLGETQIKRVKQQCLKVNESYHAGPDELDFQDNDYYINIGWIQALNLVLEINTQSPISEKPLGDYEKGYNILMQFWDHLPDAIKPSLDKELKELGL